jgi:hypothetical protein
MPREIDTSAPQPGPVDLPRIGPAPRVWTRGLFLPLLVTLLIVLAAGGAYVFRDRVVARWPQTAPVYELAGLSAHVDALPSLANLRYTRRQVLGENVLDVEGEIYNETDQALAVPRLVVSLRSDGDALLHEWSFGIDQATIQPGEVIPFKSEMKSPPPEATRIAVKFEGGR